MRTQFFPLKLVGKNDYRAYVTFAIIIGFVLVFFWEVGLTVRAGQPIDDFLTTYAFTPCTLGQEPIQETLVDAVRAIFMTTTFIDLLLNAAFFWIFGPLVEQFMGRRRYLSFFILAGIGGYIFSTIVSNSCDPLVGPNSAIAAVLAAFIFLYPAKRIQTVVTPFFFRSFDFPAALFVLIYLAMQFLATTEAGPLSGDFSPIWDEIGGLLIGFVFIFIFTTFFKTAPAADPFEYLDDESTTP